MTKPMFELTVTDEIDAAAESVIEAGLQSYNHQIANYTDARALAVLVCDPNSKEVIGGLLGRTSLGLLFIDLIFLPQHLRGSGLGAQIMERAEQEAKDRGCSAAVLYTITFQAPGFYERLGYRALGRIECRPPGHTRLCMTKTFPAQEPEDD